MLALEQYQLLDFGGGRKLERFGGVTLDRPCPAADPIAPADASAWHTADWRFERASDTRESWLCRAERPIANLPWVLQHEGFALELKRAESGHIGAFPEQAANWDWIRAQVREGERTISILNLFAYTGGSTLAAAAAGAAVTHVDAANGTVAWARRNSELSHLRDAPVRWIAEDACRFASRELKRGRHYDAVVLDPPSYGHGPHGQPWKLAEHLPRLLRCCRALTGPRPAFVVLSCHSPGYDAAVLGAAVREHWPDLDIDACALHLRTATGRALDCGAVARGTITCRATRHDALSVDSARG